MRKMIFVSTGRSGTTRLAEILRKHTPRGNFNVVHQVNQSRVCNILGNIMYWMGDSQWLKEKLWAWVVQSNCRTENFITTDPLVSMILPNREILSEDVCIVHLKREEKEFAKSMFRFSRSRAKSFIAHNFIPFWQPYLYPLENLFNPRILSKYTKIALAKEIYFEERYRLNPNYKILRMDEVFQSEVLAKTLNSFYSISINIPQSELLVKSNATKE